MTVERDTLVKQLRMYGNVDDFSDRTDEQLLNMIKGYVKKGVKREYADVCPYFVGVSHLGVYDWKIGCSLKKGCDVTPQERKNWACTQARNCFQPIGKDFKGFERCRFYSDEKKKGEQVKQKYICKCGKVFEKDTSADTTGFRLGANYSPEHECYGCPFVLPVCEGYPEQKIVDYECRASRKISYQTTADLPRSRDGFHVGRIRTLDMDFARKVWEFARGLEGQDGNRKELDFRAACFGADGRYELTLYFTKTKAGIASSLIVSDQFFDGGNSRPELTEEQEKELVLKQIERSKAHAKNAPGSLSPAADQAVSGEALNQRSIDHITMEINFYKAQTAQSIIEIGKRLLEAKQLLPHGEWLPWLRDKVDFSEISAQRFMKIAKEFSNPSPVTDLPYTKLLALLQVPESEREEFIQVTHLIDGQEKTVSEMSKRELGQAIRERNEAQRNERLMREKCYKAEREAAQAQEAKKKEYDNYMTALVKAEKAEETLDTLRSSRRFDLQRITELEGQIKELESRPVDVAVREPSETEKQQLRDEGACSVKSLYEKQLSEARCRLEEAQNQARQKMALDPDDIIMVSGAFKDAIDAAENNFLLTLKVFPAKLAINAIAECSNHMIGIVADLRSQTAEIQNIALMDDDIDLPPADGMEG